MKIYIFEGYVWTSEWFQMSSGIYRSTGGVTGTPRRVNGPYWALVGEMRRRPGGGRAPKPNPNWVGGAPLSLSHAPPSFLSYSN